MSYFDIFENIKFEINKIIDSHKYTDDDSAFLPELQKSLEFFSNDLSKLLSNHEVFLDKHKKFKNKLTQMFQTNRQSHKDILVKETLHIDNSKNKALMSVSNQLREDLRIIDYEIDLLKIEEKNFLKDAEALDNTYINRLKQGIYKFESFVNDIETHYYNAIELYNISGKSSGATTHSSRSKISHNLEELQNQAIREIEDQIVFIQNDIDNLGETILQIKATTRKSIIEENSFLNTMVLNEKRLLHEKLHQLQVSNKALSVQTEDSLKPIIEVSEANRRNIMSSYIDTLHLADMEYHKKFNEVMIEKDSVIQEYQEICASIQKNLEHLKSLVTSTERSDIEVDSIGKKLNVIKEQHKKDLDRIEALQKQTSKNLQFQKYKAEIDKNTKLAIEEQKTNLNTNVVKEHLQLIKDLFQKDVKLLNSNHELTLHNAGANNDKVLLKFEMDMKYQQVATDYKTFNLTTRISNLRAEKDYNKQIHSLVKEFNHELTNRQIDYDNLLSMLNSERYKKLRGVNHQIRKLTQYNCVNEWLFLDENLKNTVKLHAYQLTSNIQFLEHTKDHLEDLSSLMSLKKRIESKCISNIENSKFFNKIRLSQTKQAINQFRIDKILLTNSYNIFEFISSFVKDCVLKIVNYTKDEKFVSSHQDSLTKLIEYFKEIDHRCIGLLAQELKLLVRTPLNVEVLSLTNAILQKRLRRHRIKELELNNQIKNIQNDLRYNKRRLANDMRLKIEIENQLSRLRFSLRQKSVLPDSDIKKQLASLRTTSKDLKININQYEQSITTANKNMRIAIADAINLDKSVPTLANIKLNDHLIRYSLLRDAIINIDNFTNEIKAKTNSFYHSIITETQILPDEKVTNFINKSSKLFNKIFKKTRLIISCELSRVYNYYIHIYDKKIHSLRKQNLLSIKETHHKIKKQFSYYSRQNIIFDNGIHRSNLKFIRNKEELLKQYNRSKKHLNFLINQSKINFFNDLVAIESNIIDGQKRYDNDLSKMTAMNQRNSRSHLKNYKISQKLIRQKLSERETSYLLELKYAPKQLKRREKELNRISDTKHQKISNEIEVVTRQRDKLLVNHRTNVNKLNKRFLENARDLKLQAAKQIDQFK